MSGWPFKAQAPSFEATPVKDVLDQIARKVTLNQVDWKKGHEEAISYFQKRGEWKNVVREYKTLLSQIPLDLELYIKLARVYLQQNQYDEMENILLRSLDVYPTLQAYRTLGDVMMQKRNASAAVQYYEKIDQFYQNPTEKFQNTYVLGYAYLHAGEFQKAKIRLLEVLRMNPNYQPAVQLLAEVNKKLSAISK
jgi:tetratricopeptide (TPR) repeat protein